MEVTRKNFKEVLTGLPKVFQNAQFIAIDTEFTGLKVEGAANINYFDTLEDLYLKNRLRVETFIAIQYGVVAFFHDEKTNKYSHQGYNFYVYPSSYSDVNFTCQSRSIEFLIQHDFDFNKLFKEGIPYLKDEEAQKLLGKLEEKFEKSQQMEVTKIVVPDEHKTIVNNVINKIKQILQTNSKQNFIIEKYNSFIRRLIYNSVYTDFGSEVYLQLNKDETLTVFAGYSSDEIKEIQKKKFLLEKEEILDQVGFSKVIKLIMESKKFLVGHNLFLDILFTINQFLTPLPKSYYEFKELATFLFPQIIDTKYMASTSEFKNIKDTSLYGLTEHLKNSKAIPEVDVVENGKGYKIDDKKCHEAAYDGFLTGLCFVAMTNHLGTCNGNSNVSNHLTELAFLKPIMNKLSVPKLHDISFMNIGGNDTVPDRHGVYHLTFPEDWTRETIYKLFKDCGFINISWINSTSAFVRVNKEYVNFVEKNVRATSSDYSVCTYSEYKTSNQITPETFNSSDSVLFGNNVANLSNSSDSPLKFGFNEASKKRQIEDVGEVIERPQKKKCSSK